MKIVILDEYTINPGDLSWDLLKPFGTITAYSRTPAKEVINRIGDADIVLTSKVKISEDIMKSCPGIKYIGVLATGFDNIDISAAMKRNIAVTNIADYSTPDVSEFVFAMILEHYNHISAHNQSVLAGDWIKSKDFAYYPFPRTELKGKVMGIIGYGAIGQRVASIGSAFGLKVLINSRTTYDKPLFKNCSFASKNEVFKRADILSLHCPLTDETRNLIDEKTLKIMKNTALLINTSRGAIVNEDALAKALKKGEISHACIDVLSTEPMQADCPLLKTPNITITPHVAWATFDSRKRIIEISANNLESFMKGDTLNRVKVSL